MFTWKPDLLLYNYDNKANKTPYGCCIKIKMFAWNKFRVEKVLKYLKTNEQQRWPIQT